MPVYPDDGPDVFAILDLFCDIAREKPCSRCGVVKPLGAFYKDRAHADNRTSCCRACDTKRRMVRIRANPQAAREQARRSRLKSAYGMTEGQYLAMVTLQDGKCAICLSEGKKLVIDHDHATGAVRGLLCNDCNQGLGRFKDQRSMLMRAMVYLSRAERLREACLSAVPHLDP